MTLTANATVSGPLAYARMKDPPEQRSHMSERFGLFVIVVLGESVLAVVNGVAAADLRAAGSTVAMARFSLPALRTVGRRPPGWWRRAWPPPTGAGRRRLARW